MSVGVKQDGTPNKKSKWRGDDDHFDTPREGSVPLIRTAIIPDNVWECACGTGALSKVLEEHGHHVVSTTLKDRGYGITGVNFLKEKKLRAPAIITNPPFSLLDDFIKHALWLNPDFLGIFGPTKLLAGADRYRDIHSKRPPSIIYQIIQRLTFYSGAIDISEQNGWSGEEMCWAVWVKGWRRETVVRWLSRDDGLQMDLFKKPKRK